MNPSFEPRLYLLAGLSACAVLTACGGGSPASPDTPSPEAAAASIVGGSKGEEAAGAELAQIEDSALAEANGLMRTLSTGTSKEASVAEATPAAPTATVAAHLPLDIQADFARLEPPVAVSVGVVTPGSGYFVDSGSGNDNNAGTSADKPFKTLKRLTGVRLSSGQGVWLKCGSVFRESFSVGIGGTISAFPDGGVIAGYGDCSTHKAMITGADAFTKNWSKSGNVWTRSVPPGTPKIRRLYVNGASMWTARWPNFRSIGAEWAIAAPTSPNSKTTLQPKANDASVLNGMDLAGATLHVRSEPFSIEERQVASYDGSLHVSAATYFAMEGGDGYALSNKRWMLDAPGEFFHDTVNNKLYVYPIGAAQSDMNSASVEGSVRDMVLKVADRSSVKVTNLELTMSRQTGLAMYSSPNSVIDNVRATRNGKEGMMVRVADQFTVVTRTVTVKNSVIDDNQRTGIDTSLAPGSLVTNNSVRNTGAVTTSAWSDAGIRGGPGSVIENNVITRSAHSGIVLINLSSSKASRNLISDYCLRLSDCGGIYTNGKNVGSRTQLSTIEYNQVLAARANVEGAIGGAPEQVAGIYLDDFAKGVTVNGNMLLGMTTGLYLHNASFSSITGNKFWLTTKVGMLTTMDKLDMDHSTNNHVLGNEFVPTVQVTGSYPALPFGGSSLAIDFTNMKSGNDTIRSGLNKFADNRLVPMFGPSMLIARATDLQLTMQGWASLNPGETRAEPPITYAAYDATLGRELIAGGDFSNGLTDWRSWASTSAPTALAPASGIRGCDGPCARFTAGSSGDLLFSPGLRMRAGIPHIITFTGVLGGTGAIEQPFITRSVAPYNYFVDDDGIATVSPRSGVAGDIIRFEGMFKTWTGDEARINLKSSGGVPVAFDSVSVREVTGYRVPAMSELAAAAYAPPSTPVTVTCPSLGWPEGCAAIDTRGSRITFPLTVNAGSSKLFLRTDTSWKR